MEKLAKIFGDKIRSFSCGAVGIAFQLCRSGAEAWARRLTKEIMQKSGRRDNDRVRTSHRLCTSDKAPAQFLEALMPTRQSAFSPFNVPPRTPRSIW